MCTSYLPGQKIAESILDSTQLIGYGIEKRKNEYLASQPGVLRTSEGKTWISVQSKRYVPQEGDRILGIVHSKQGDIFKIDLGSADLANISYLNFEGATKRNRPNLKIGDILYARISQTSKHLEPELTCIDQYNRAKGLGLISSNSGLFFKVSLNLSRRLLSPNCQLLALLGKDFKFEITIGLNGRIWINASDFKDIAAIRRIIMSSEYVLDANIAVFIETEIRRYRGFHDLPMETN